MNFPLVSKLLSVVMLTLTLAFAACLGISFMLDEPEHALLAKQAFIASIITSLFAAGVLFFTGRGASTKFFRKEALAVIGLAWILASLLGAIPYLIITPQLGFSGAIFESASGLTTTGASVMSNLQSLPDSLLFWRSLSQWIGGMGVVVFFVAILGFLGAGAKMLYANEASGSTADFEDSRVQSSVSKIIYVYFALSVACAVCYHLAGMDWFDSICHMFTTVSTAGFSTRDASIGAFDSALIEWTSICFMFLAGTSFLLIIKIARGSFSSVLRNTEFITYACLLLGATLLVSVMLLSENHANTYGQALRMSAFNITSILTTTGYASADFAQWSSLSQVTLLILMTIGGCSGSTAGGVKIVRIVIAARLCLVSIEHSFRSRVVRRVKMNQRAVNDGTANDVMVFLILISLVCIISVPIVSIFEPNHELDTNMSAVLACLFNTGPGIAEIGPTENFGFLRPQTKLFLSLLMVMGRLELYAILVLFAPSLWKRFK